MAKGEIRGERQMTSFIKTYIQGMDKKLEGGIPRGSVVLVCGPAGSLKSTIVLNIMYHHCIETKENGLYISLEQNRKSLVEQMKKFGKDIDAISDRLVILDLGWIRREMKMISEDRTIPTPLWIMESKNWIETITKYIRKYREEIKITTFALDSLNALYAMSEFKNPRAELFYFFEDLRSSDMTSFMILEVSMGELSNIGPYGVESFLADGIIHLSLEKINRTVGRYISVLKMRKVRHSTDYHPLLIDQNGIRILER